MIDLVIDAVVAFALLAGAFFTFVGSIALLKLSSPMARLHGPTKASTLGVGSLLFAVILDGFAGGAGSLREALIMAFLFVTAPITANFIAKVHMHRDRNESSIPAPSDGSDWACLKQPGDAAIVERANRD